MAADEQAQRSATQVIHLVPPSSSVEVRAEHILRFDWGSTPLGALSQWPPSLRIAVDIMLLSPFPCALAWGKELTLIPSQNYLALLADDQSQVGVRFDQLWQVEWERIGPRVFQALDGRASFVDESPLQVRYRENGDYAWFAFGYAPLHDEQGVVAGILHTAINTTASVEQIRQWRELAQGFQQQIGCHLPNSDYLWRFSRDAMIIVSRDLELLAANDAWRRVLGWDQQSLSAIAVVDFVHPADRAEVRLAINELLLGEVVEQVESRLRHKDGYYRWMSWSARPEGDVLIAVGRDITEERTTILREAENLLRDSQRMETVGQLAGGMAHEMNNLLAGIGGSLELLQRRLGQGRLERIDEYVHVARDSVQRAMALTHRLLAFSSSQPLQPRLLDVNSLLRGLEPLIHQALGPEFVLNWQLDLAPWPVQVDPGQLEVAILNLCSNAQDAVVERGRLTIRTANERFVSGDKHGESIPAGDYVAIHVEDEGQGMPADVVSRAFEPFFTTKPKGRGAGLGLPMIYGFARQSGGYVWIQSMPGKGTQVTLLFPRHPGELPVVSEGVEVPVLKRGRSERILLVDDEVNLRALMKEVLVEHGFDVTEAGDAGMALERYREGGLFDLVITDIGLPGGMSGRQVGKTIRQAKPLQKILFITGYTAQPIERSLLDQPGTALMLKPFSLESLAVQVQRMLEP
ncbi:ATP-binding protein [Pseudomonas sp. RW3S2]|uniref:hybrid sensor histidine kinase/response regulator n=1 Tax=Pseudomonas sp. RW3S2 TaxID=485884 RepID=UPI0016493E36|nr:ATP-binding protein [Pseudomonas sp. RW3S2]MBC3419703.1 response regulator [Pseudomonas sp. RW3S2]